MRFRWYHDELRKPKCDPVGDKTRFQFDHGTMVPWYQVSVGKIGFGRVDSANDYIYDIAQTITFAMWQKLV